MVRQFTFVLSFLIATLSHAGPNGFSVVGGLYTSDGEAFSGIYDFHIQVLDKDAKCVMYEEYHTSIDLTLSSGEFSFVLGSGTGRSNKLTGGTDLSADIYRNDSSVSSFSGCASGLTFSSTDHRLLRVSYNPGPGYITMEPDITIQSTPYAVVAETLQGKKTSDFIQVSNDVTQDGLSDLLSGTSTTYYKAGQMLDMGSQPIVNLPNPTSSTDAATKGYVDSIVGTGIGGKASNLSNVDGSQGDGRILTWDQAGNRWIASNPAGTGDFRADGSVAAGGNFTMSTNKIVSLGDPTAAQDAATKNYVDTKTWSLANITDEGTMASANTSDYYTQTNMQTSGQASLHWGNLTNIPADIADGDADTVLNEATVDAYANNNGYLTSETGDIEGVTTTSGSSGLTGGATTGTPSLSVDITGTTAETTVAAGDEILIYDASAGGLRKMTRSNFVAGLDTQLSEANVETYVNNANFSMASNKIINLADPTLAQDAATKNYADSNLVGETLSSPAAGQDGQAVRWNNGAGNWEYYTPGSSSADIDGITTTASTSGLTGGALSGTPSLSVDITGTTAETTVAAGDEILIYDASAGGLRKMTRSNFVAGIDTDTQLNEAAVDAFVANNGYLTSETGDIEGITTTSSTSGLTGGATTGTPSLSVDITGTTAETTVAAGDEILIYDASAGGLRKMTRSNFVAGIDTDTQLNEAAVDAFVANNGYLTSETGDIEGITTTSSTSGLTGGATTGTPSLSVDITGTAAETTVAAGDEILIYDASAGGLRKMTRSNFVAGIDTDTQLSEANVETFVNNANFSMATNKIINLGDPTLAQDAATKNYTDHNILLSNHFG